MGGPGARVILREPLSGQQRTELENWIHSIVGRWHEESDSSVYQFWLKEELFGEAMSRCLFYLSIEEPGMNPDLMEDEEMEQVLAQLGYLPRQAIGISSGCNDKSDHRSLGLLMLHLAETYDGLVDMGGAIQPPLPPWPNLQEELKKSQSKAPLVKAYLRARLKEIEEALPPGTTMPDLFRQRHSDPHSPLNALDAELLERFGPLFPERSATPLEEISAYVHAFPGRAYEIYYTTANHKRWVYHIVDADFLRAWMKDAHFYMVK